MQLQMIDDRCKTMPWDEIDNVVFDVGNVLLTFSPDKILAEVLPGCPEKYPALKHAVFSSPYWVMMDLGAASQEELTALMVSTAPELKEEITAIMQNWVRVKEPIAEGIHALEACHAHGKKLYVLSNYGRHPFETVESHFDFFRLFDGKVVSSHIHLLKPDPAIYRHLTDTFGLEPARTLFIDDNPPNICAAIWAGWQGLCFNRQGKLNRFFGE